MQRILKYHLLLDKLVHETSPTHDDYRGLERAKEAMVDVAQYSNEVKRDTEHLVVIRKVNGVESRQVLNVERILAGQLADVELQPGDEIHVPDIRF